MVVMAGRWRIRAAVCGLVWSLGAVSGALAGPQTTVGFWIELPEGITSGALFWGLRWPGPSGGVGVELARGTEDVAKLA